jgi:hypothetical protein
MKDSQIGHAPLFCGTLILLWEKYAGIPARESYSIGCDMGIRFEYPKRS